MANSIYIHIPFCKTICSYCDFCKLYYDKCNITDYLNALENEIKKIYNGEIIDTIYIGGGTPSVLSIEELTKLFEIVKLFKLNKKCEFTVECNINDINDSILELFKINNVNRVSIGVQTINNRYLKFLNREHTKDEVITKVNKVKKYFDNFNIDLMYAFPNQTLEELMEDLSFIVSLKPSHISTYSLIIEEHTKIYLDKVKPLDDELESSMYYNIISFLENNGFNHYEISNFAKHGYESKHNLVYWSNKEYYGFGLSASGYINNIRYTNTRSLNNYLKNKYILDEDFIDKNISMENELIFGLRKTNGISIKEFSDKFNKSIYDVFNIKELIDKKLLVESDGRLFIPNEKLYVSNSILVNFIGGSKNDS